MAFSVYWWLQLFYCGGWTRETEKAKLKSPLTLSNFDHNKTAAVSHLYMNYDKRISRRQEIQNQTGLLEGRGVWDKIWHASRMLSRTVFQQKLWKYSELWSLGILVLTTSTTLKYHQHSALAMEKCWRSTKLTQHQVASIGGAY